MYVYVYKERRQISNTFVVVSVIIFRITKFYLLQSCNIWRECVRVCVCGCSCVWEDVVGICIYVYSKSSNWLRCFFFFTFTNWPDSTLSKHITCQLINICMYVDVCMCIYKYVIRLLLFHVFIFVYVIDHS